MSTRWFTQKFFGKISKLGYQLNSTYIDKTEANTLSSIPTKKKTRHILHIHYFSTLTLYRRYITQTIKVFITYFAFYFRSYMIEVNYTPKTELVMSIYLSFKQHALEHNLKRRYCKMFNKKFKIFNG